MDLLFPNYYLMITADWFKIIGCLGGFAPLVKIMSDSTEYHRNCSQPGDITRTGIRQGFGRRRRRRYHG
jgi:hypothetical protein